MSPRIARLAGAALVVLALTSCVGVLDDDSLAGPPPPPFADGSSCLDGCVGELPLTAITREEYGHAVEDVLGVHVAVDALPTDGNVDFFATNVVAVRGPEAASSYETVATSVAEAAVPALASRCDRASCVRSLVGSLGARLYRRPLEADELDLLEGLYQIESGASGHDEALAAVVSALLQSPTFLYRVELGEGTSTVRPLSGLEIAGRLAAFLWRSVPDDALLAAAASGALAHDDGLRAEVRRMIADARFERAVRTFHEAWLTSTVVAPRDGLDDAIVEDMREELSRYTLAVLRSDRPTLQHLLTEDEVPLSSALAAHYGVEAPSTEWGSVSMPERAGILGRGLPAVAVAHSSDTRSIHRGLLVYRRLLCRAVGAPPDDATRVTSEFVRDPSWSDREYVTHLTLDQPRCASCHAAFGPIGFALDDVDLLGRSDPSHPPVAGRLDDMDFGSLVDLEGLLSNGQVEDCVIRRWLGFALGRAAEDADVRSLAEVDPTLRTGRGELDLRALIEDVTLARTFRERRATP